MPELPEVETIVRGLNKKVIGRKILGAWTDWPATIRTHTLANFTAEIAGRKILRAHRRAKYIMMDLSGSKTLIIHQKISGHLLYGKWIPQNQEGEGEKNQERKNQEKEDQERGEEKEEKRKMKSLSFYHDRGEMIVSKLGKLGKFGSSGKLGPGKLGENRVQKNQKWIAVMPGPLRDDSYNRFIRFILFLDNDYQLGLSDLRRFGKVFLGDTGEIENINEIGKLGPEPLDPKFTFAKFKELMTGKRGVIKKVLMDPFFIAGIGNIYSDEILWYADVHPLHRVEKLADKDLAALYKYMKFVLKKAIAAKGDSQQDYRTLEGKFGNYQNMQKAYQLTGEKCQKRDGGIIKRLKINNRSAHFCPEHQK